MLIVGTLQNRLEFELRLQQYIELRRNGQLVEARQHAQKYLTQHAGTYLEEVNRAAGLLAYRPDTQVQEYKVRSHTETFIACMLTETEIIFRISMGRPSQTLRQYPPRALLTPCTSTPPHSAFRRTFGSQDTFLPFEACEQHSKCKFDNDIGLSDLLNGAE